MNGNKLSPILFTENEWDGEVRFLRGHSEVHLTTSCTIRVERERESPMGGGEPYWCSFPFCSCCSLWSDYIVVE